MIGTIIIALFGVGITAILLMPTLRTALIAGIDAVIASVAGVFTGANNLLTAWFYWVFTPDSNGYLNFAGLFWLTMFFGVFGVMVIQSVVGNRDTIR